MVSAVIIAEKIDAQIQENLKPYEKSDSMILDPSGKYLFYLTIENVLKTDVDECLLMLHEDSDEITELLELNIRYVKKDKRLKIITFSEGLELIEILLKGINEVKSDYCLCIRANQPSISPETLKKLIDKTSPTDDTNIISILERKKFKILNDDYKMPFVCKTEILKKYLSKEKTDLNLALKKVIKNARAFKVLPVNKYELITINSCKDFKNFLNFNKGISYKPSQLSLILNLFSWNKLSKNFKIFFAVYLAFLVINLILMFVFPSNFFFTNMNNLESLIGTIVQSESAIIAIIITLSLVAVQLTASSYSPRVINIFKNSLSLWILIISYLSTMTYGLILLKFIEINSNNEIQLWIALFLSIFTFFALIPFLLDMLDLMKPSRIIDKLGSEINDYQVLYSIEKFDEEDEIQPLIDIIHSSLMKYDYGTLRKGLTTISKYTERVFTNTKTFEFEKRKIYKCILEHLTRVEKLAINLNDEDAANLILITISYNIGQLKDKTNEEMFDAVLIIIHIADLSIKKGLPTSTFTALMFLQNITLSKAPKLIIDHIIKTYDKFEELTTDESVLNQISANRELFKKIKKQ